MNTASVGGNTMNGHLLAFIVTQVPEAIIQLYTCISAEPNRECLCHWNTQNIQHHLHIHKLVHSQKLESNHYNMLNKAGERTAP